MEKILTVPEALRENGKVFCTGNDYVSLCNISADGVLHTLSHLRERTMGLIEYSGEKLISLEYDGRPLEAASSRYVHDFIPEFSLETQDYAITWQYFAPEGIRGFGVRCTLSAKTARQGKLSLHCQPEQFIRTVFHPLPLAAEPVYGYDKWSDTVYVELVSGGGLSALTLGAQGSEKECAPGRLCLHFPVSMAAGEEKEFQFFLSMGCELDGARLANVDMRRRAKQLYPKTAALLDRHHISLPHPVLEQRTNLNLAFCRYFSLGRTLDTDRLVLVTSKSGRYYVSGAYWARDCMLWAFPALLRWDVALAREALLAACSTYLKEGANHALYINGVSLYPGFELDQLVAPIIALECYVNRTGDREILAHPQIREAAAFTLKKLGCWRDADTGLFATELSPSDDPCAYPFLTYNNCLVLCALRFLNPHFEVPAGWISALGEGLKTHCIRDGIYLWASDGKGGGEEYDNPPGSLMLIPYYGGCEISDPVWEKTYNLYFSKENPWYTENDLLRGQGCEHAPAPWPMSLCNLLLSRGREEAVLQSLAAMEMDNGIACETVWPDNGKLCTGAAFATFAGFYANAVVQCHED